MVQLNEALAEEQKITQEQRDELQNLYSYMSELLKQANEDKDIKNGDKEVGKSYSERMTNLELELQKNWNFPQDILKHTWWNRFRNCSCPDWDNRERFGQEKIITCDCVFHGHLCDGD